MALSAKPPTIQDVARRAQVSSATVSRVLSNPDRVSPQARERVFAAVRETGYIVNEAARSLRLRSSRTIVAALPHIGDPFYSIILETVLSTAARRGYTVLVAAQLEGAPNRWLSDYLHSNRADGLLIFDGSLDTQLLRKLAPDTATLPLVAAYDELPDPQVNSVLTDNRAAAGRAVRHLIDLGHRRIAHVLGPSRNAAPNERLVGFRKTMAEAGLEVRDEWMIPGTYTIPSGIAAVEHLLTLDELPTAVFCGNDETAIGVMWRFRQAGVQCPHDISIVGFDDIGIAPYLWPPLTTVRQPREDIGRMATEAVIDIIEGVAGDQGPLHFTLTADLVVRESTAPPAGFTS
jgi:LacI family repressor for deo operon, udp, cdd, tsx, nupC, and nupG